MLRPSNFFLTNTVVVYLFTVILASMALPTNARTQLGSEPGMRVWSKLQQAHLIDDNYFPDDVREIAETLALAAPGTWRGVQVNSAYRSGWLNIYMVDGTHLRSDTLLADEGVEHFRPETLKEGALAHKETGIIFLNTAASKRLAAATVMNQTGRRLDLTAALALVDAYGLQKTRKYWDPATLSHPSEEMKRVGWLLRGTAAFVLAHEMGHLRIGHSSTAEAERVWLKNLTDQQKDERTACPETLPGDFQKQQRHEQAADAAAVQLLGQQCRLSPDGEIRHHIYMLGTTWYFRYAMSDKLLEMGRNTTNPFIEKTLRTLIGSELYELAIADFVNDAPRGAVSKAFPKTHPPDYARILAIELAMQNTPCGSGGLDLSYHQMLETFRASMCSSLIAKDGVK